LSELRHDPLAYVKQSLRNIRPPRFSGLRSASPNFLNQIIDLSRIGLAGEQQYVGLI
jgi:hypothetical protein